MVLAVTKEADRPKELEKFFIPARHCTHEAVCAMAINGQLVVPQRGWDHWGDEHKAVICHWRCALCSVKGFCCLSILSYCKLSLQTTDCKLSY